MITILKMILSVMVTDLFTGAVHWWEDTYGNPILNLIHFWEILEKIISLFGIKPNRGNPIRNGY
jgi:hypothetical protein